MTPAQRDLAFALLKTGLSAQGFTRAESIRSLENVLRAMENRNSRDPEMYFFTIFGDPAGAKWGWRYEGHHLAQNWTINAGKAVATSPAFFGANPAEVMDGPMKGTRALPAERDQGWALLKMLSDNELKLALAPGAAPNEIITGNTRKAAVLDPIGITYAQMSPAVQKALIALIDVARVVAADSVGGCAAGADPGGRTRYIAIRVDRRDDRRRRAPRTTTGSRGRRS